RRGWKPEAEGGETSEELRTTPCPEMHVPVGYCWQHSRCCQSVPRTAAQLHRRRHAVPERPRSAAVAALSLLNSRGTSIASAVCCSNYVLRRREGIYGSLQLPNSDFKRGGFAIEKIPRGKQFRRSTHAQFKAN